MTKRTHAQAVVPMLVRPRRGKCTAASHLNSAILGERAPIMTVNRSLTIRRLARDGELAALAADWDRLASSVPTRSFAWHSTWWRHYGQPHETNAARRELFVLVATDSDGHVAGIAPLYRESGTQRGQVLRLLGSGEVCTDYVTILCRRGREREVAEAMAEWLRAARERAADHWDAMELDGVCSDDAGWIHLADALERRRCLVHRRAGQHCWRVALPATWEEYLAELSKSHRKQLRQLDARVLQLGRARLCWASTAEELAHGIELLVDLHRRRRESIGERGCFESPRFTAFLSDVAQQLLVQKNLRLCWLELHGRPVAAEFQLLGDDTVFAFQSGIDPAALGEEPGRLITIETIKLAIREGRTAYDFMRGDEPYKAHWRAIARPTVTIRIAAGGAARLRQTLWLAGDGVKRLVKKGLALSKV